MVKSKVSGMGKDVLLTVGGEGSEYVLNTTPVYYTVLGNKSLQGSCCLEPQRKVGISIFEEMGFGRSLEN